MKDGVNFVEHRNSVRNWNRSFVEVFNYKSIEATKNERSHVRYSTTKEVNDRLRKAFVGKVNIPCSTYEMQTKLEMEGYYNVKVTPLGQSLCLLEES